VIARAVGMKVKVRGGSVGAEIQRFVLLTAIV